MFDVGLVLLIPIPGAATWTVVAPKLEKVVNFKSGYAMRLFELLKKEQFKADGKGYFKRSFEYDELRGLFGIEKSEYKLFADFRIKAIEVSVKEINANPDISIIKVDYPKTGRKVSHIVFHCEKAKQLQLDIDEPPPKFEEEIVHRPKIVMYQLRIDAGPGAQSSRGNGSIALLLHQLLRSIQDELASL